MLQAVYDWIIDNGCTPYVVVSTQHPEVSVPEEYVSDHQIILNLNMSAVQNFQMTREDISFQARFQGVVRSIYFPMHAITAIYAKENGQGIVFANDETAASTSEDTDNQSADSASHSIQENSAHDKPTLKLVK